MKAVSNYVASMAGNYDGKIVACSDVRDVVANADVLVSGTVIKNKPDPFVKGEWLRRTGVYLAPVDVDSVWEWEAINRMKFVTDDWKQTGHYRSIGCFPNGMPKLHAELGQIVCERKPGRENDDENICNISIGMAVEDVPSVRRFTSWL